jgi:hypothetical protein
MDGGEQTGRFLMFPSAWPLLHLHDSGVAQVSSGFRRNEIFVYVASPSAPLPPTAVRTCSHTLLTQGLSLSARSAPRERPGLTYIAPTALESRVGQIFVAPGCIFEKAKHPIGQDRLREGLQDSEKQRALSGRHNSSFVPCR